MKDLKEFENQYKKINKSNNDDKYCTFAWNLVGWVDEVWHERPVPFMDYHYSIMIDKETNPAFKYRLWWLFHRHGDNAFELLLSKLENGKNVEYHGDIISCLGRDIIEGIGRYGKYKKRTLEYAIKLTNNCDNWIRENAIIVLGWLGSSKEIGLLGNLLLNDTNAKCRAWSATSFMHIYFNCKKNKLMVDKSLHYFKQAISQETDYYALGCMIDVVKELTGKKFDLPQYAIENIDTKRIDNAKLKVERFFKKLYNE